MIAVDDISWPVGNVAYLSKTQAGAVTLDSEAILKKGFRGLATEISSFDDQRHWMLAV